MRPIDRGDSPRDEDYGNYRDAFPDLASRLGFFCSYCERRIVTYLAVEHVQPKTLPQYEHLVGRWDNFLLGCVNCNSTKRDRDVVFDELLLPDRDNTSHAYRYIEDGTVEVSALLSADQAILAEKTLWLTGLDKTISKIEDENGQFVAVDRVRQRKEVRLLAIMSQNDLEELDSESLKRHVVELALAHGYFSIWMTVFSENVEMRKRFISAFPGTATDCFDAVALATVSPRPNNGLDGASKV